MSPPTDEKRPPLDQATIVAGAVALADAEGPKSLTMRNVAHSIGFEVMSLYNHIANKDALLALMVDSVAGEIAEPDPDLAPLAAVRALAVATREALVRHPWASDLWLRHVPGPARIRQMELLLSTFAASGLSAELAHHGFHAVNNHVLGYTLQEREMAMGDDDPERTIQEFVGGLSPDDHPHTIAHVQQHIDGDTSSSFEIVLDLILDGLQRLDDG